MDAPDPGSRLRDLCRAGSGNGAALPRGRHGLPRHFVARSQRERMLAAMATAVCDHGYRELTVKHVVEGAGVSTKTFYQHFADKEACFLAAYDAAVDRLLEVVTAAYGTPAAWRDRFRAGLDAFLQFLAAEPEFARMCTVEVVTAGPAALERRDRTMAAFADFLVPPRDEAPAGLPPIVSETYVGGIYEIVYARVLQGHADVLPSLRPQLMYWLLAPYLGHTEASRELTEFADWRLS